MEENSIIANRLAKNLKKLKKWLNKENIQAYRLYDRDIPEYPYIVDVYPGHAIIFEKGKKLGDDLELHKLRAEHQDQILSACIKVLNLPIESIIFKERVIKTGTTQYQKKSQTKDFFTIQENGVFLEINLRDYLDTGIFLDHRPLRKIIKDSSRNKKVLNLFSYTGSISIMAAMGGARQVTSVDMSKTYTQWCERNFELNHVKQQNHKFITQDCFEFLKHYKDKFDIIILDPPSFSNSKKMENFLDIQRDHPDLIHSCMKLLLDKGTLYFSNNLRKFKLEAQLTEQYVFENITHISIPSDFRDKKIHQCFKITKK